MTERSATNRLSEVLDRIDAYLEQREDVRDGSDRPLPNEEMTLLTDLRYARSETRPTTLSEFVHAPNAVREAVGAEVVEAAIQRQSTLSAEQAPSFEAIMAEGESWREEMAALYAGFNDWYRSQQFEPRHYSWAKAAWNAALDAIAQAIKAPRSSARVTFDEIPAGAVHRPPFAYEYISRGHPETSAGHYRIHDANDNALCICYSEDNAQEIIGWLNRAPRSASESPIPGVEALVKDWELHDRPIDSRWAALAIRSALAAMLR